ncbi:helix-turn-helix domain-containing protein [Mycobacteroides immunogenum]|uniref:helix-turn-helix domain-containing protein n=1 Tax=Mycobacteroides immunogenum TaxID=83262 RepID=UPI000697C971|nr:helix-turn-helix domain-containing protein [Mycobacteroides immunogenum]ANO05068.1 hypothetical protein BAB75_18495 [Mycobacteroides immunogenum]MCV7307179.1 helix-turn-helix domain-containing protein [Mycobacteroides immunogenum]
MPENWEALARAVRARRADLGISQAAVQDRGGPSDIVIGRIENNEKPRPRGDTLRKLDLGLGWSEGHSLSILAGAAQSVPQGSDDRVKRFVDATERRHRGLAVPGDEKVIRDFLDEERELVEQAPPERKGPLVDIVRATLDSYKTTMEGLISLIENPEVSEDDRRRLSKQADALSASMIDYLIKTAHEVADHSSEIDMRVELDKSYEFRASIRDRLKEDRLPPPDLNDPDVVTSRREKRADAYADALKDAAGFEVKVYSLSEKNDYADRFVFDELEGALGSVRDELKMRGEAEEDIEHAVDLASKTGIGDTRGRGFRIEVNPLRR